MEKGDGGWHGTVWFWIYIYLVYIHRVRSNILNTLLLNHISTAHFLFNSTLESVIVTT